nr:MAG TPA: hypothetical protein [Caudoviricetes sp.]
MIYGCALLLYACKRLWCDLRRYNLLSWQLID